MQPTIHKYESAPKRRNPFASRARVRVALSLIFAIVAACGGDGIAGNPSGPGEPAPIPVAAVAVDPSTGALTVGQTFQLHALPKDAAGRALDGRTIVWSTSNAAVAEVSGTGVVTAMAAGSVRIVAASEGKRGEAELTVSEVRPAKVIVAPEAATLAWNGEATLAAQVFDVADQPLPGRLVRWQSSDRAIAEVDASGHVTAKGQGTVTIYAIADDVTGVCEVTVQPAPVARVVLPDGPISLEPGESVLLAARLEDPLGRALTGRAVTWGSSNQNSGIITPAGRVYAWQPGTTRITATSEGVSATVDVSVFPRPEFDLVYHRATPPTNAEIFVLGLGTAGAAPVRINAGDMSRDPFPSPDGKRIAFAVHQPDLVKGGWMDDLFVVGRDGMNVVWLTRDPEYEIEPAWSPDGTRIAFTKLDISTGARDVWVVNADGTGAVNLTASMGSGDASSEYAPAWSPDGQRIAFTVSSYGIGGRIWTIGADGSDARPLAIDGSYDMHPTWSPDGTRIAFARVDGLGSSDIMIASVTGGGVTRLGLAGEQWAPEWSPAGDYIAFVQRGTEGRSQIYTMRPDGSGVRLRTTDASWGGGDQPSWIRRQ